MVRESNPMTIGDYFTLQRGTTYKSSMLENQDPCYLVLRQFNVMVAFGRIPLGHTEANLQEISWSIQGSCTCR